MPSEQMTNVATAFFAEEIEPTLEYAATAAEAFDYADSRAQEFYDLASGGGWPMDEIQGGWDVVWSRVEDFVSAKGLKRETPLATPSWNPVPVLYGAGAGLLAAVAAFFVRKNV